MPLALQGQKHISREQIKPFSLNCPVRLGNGIFCKREGSGQNPNLSSINFNICALGKKLWHPQNWVPILLRPKDPRDRDQVTERLAFLTVEM